MINTEQFLSRAGESMRESAIRKMGTVLADAHDMVSFAPGYPSETAFPWDAFRGIADDLLAGQQAPVLQYGATRGYRPLLDIIETIMRERGIATSTDRLLVTNGSQQGLDLLARILFDPGDVVLMELPSYTGAIAAFRGVGAELVGVPQQDDGIDVEALEATVLRLKSEGRRVKCLYLVPNFQNPTGQLIGLAKRRELLEVVSRHDFLIIEDDPYRDLYFEDVAGEADTRPVAADDTDGRVIYLSSFSKTLAPGFRVAWLNTVPALMSRLELAKQASDLCTSGLSQQIVGEACVRGLLASQLPVLRAHYREKRDAMVEALQAELGDTLHWKMPRGGFFLWARLGAPLDGDMLLPYAQARGVIFVCGSAFFVTGQDRQYIRLSFSSPTLERIGEGARRLALAVSDARAGLQSQAATAAQSHRGT